MLMYADCRTLSAYIQLSLYSLTCRPSRRIIKQAKMSLDSADRGGKSYCCKVQFCSECLGCGEPSMRVRRF